MSPVPVSGEIGYYNVPLLKRPKWGDEIVFYFFFEGISAGAFILAGLADLLARGRYPDLVRRGRYLALATLAPCPPLLIADLGRPERFLHMLRIVKHTSPMNTGAWALSGYGIFAALLAARQMDIRIFRLLRWIPPRLAFILGLPFALTMLAYPGVLLSATSNPAWAHTRVLGALFAASSMSAAAAALLLINPGEPVLHDIENLANVCEAGAFAAFLSTSPAPIAPLNRAAQVALSAAPTLLRMMAPKRKRGFFGILGSLLTLSGALALKWAITRAGQAGAATSRPNRLATKHVPRL
ncbi:MAG: polysulfide reductase [Bryobacterales bacterium]|nr:polysulfide reductase [Bryobacterales bacterium]